MTDLSPEPRTGTQHDIAAGDYRATVTELGAGLRQLSYRGQPVISGYAADDVPPAGSGQLLIPWPNRVDHGRYPFGGSTHQLDLSEPAHGNAIHGLTRFANWASTQHAADRVELAHVLHAQPGYPFCLELTAAYGLSADGLEVTVTARNAGSAAAPYGTGSHPYLVAGPGYRWLQVFTGDTLGPDRARRALAIEPMTCPPNAFVTGTDLLTLAPGETVTTSWGLQARPAG